MLRKPIALYPVDRDFYPMNNIIHPFEQLGPDVAERGYKALKYIVRKKLICHL